MMNKMDEEYYAELVKDCDSDYDLLASYQESMQELANNLKVKA
jgi:hypothetical protein